MWLLLWCLQAGAADVKIDVGQADSVVVKALGAIVFVPACRGVTWSRFDAEAGKFEPTFATGCGPLTNAIRVDAAGVEFEVDMPLPPLPDVGFHLLRPTVVYGLKCKDETPFPLAKCESIESVDGPQILVRNRGAGVPVTTGGGG